MTYDQIVAAGIDPSSPANQNVYQFSVHLAFDTSGSGSTTASVSGYTATGGFPLCPQVADISVSCEGSEATFTTGGYTISISTSYAHGQPQLVWLVIPAKASWLKEFFTVQMMVTNLADPSFVLDHGTATLPLPAGLSLAPTATPQTDTVRMPDIPGGASATATWLVRGDTEGYYDLTSSYAGSLEPFGDTIAIDATTQKPLHVWGGSAIEITIDAEQDIWDRYPYHVRVGLKNVADVPIYNASVELLSQGKQHYLYQPREALRQGTAQIDPQTTFWTDDYILAPDISGTLDLAASFVEMASGTSGPSAKIISHPSLHTPQDTPILYAAGLKDQVGLQWESVPGATGYEIYSTPDRATDFPDTPVLTVPAGTTSATVPLPQGTDAWFAVSSIINGKHTLVHPIVDGTPSTQVIQPVSQAKLSSTASCGADIGVSAQFDDPFFDLTGWTATLDGTPYSPAGSGSLSGRQDVAAFKVMASDIKPGGSILSITATDSSGATGPAWTGRVSTECNPIRMLVVGDSIAWGQGLLDQDKYPNLVAQWLRQNTGRGVEYEFADRNLAHSGAVVDPSAGCSPDIRTTLASDAAGEVPSATPDIGGCQVSAAKAIPADLILVDGCINDIDPLNIVFNPVAYLSVPNKCGQPVTDMLLKLHQDHPNAEIVYTGYYPIIDQTLSPSQLLEFASAFGISKAALADLAAESFKINSSNFDTSFRTQASEDVKIALTAQPGTWLEYADPAFVTGDGLFDSNSKLFGDFNDPFNDPINDPMRSARMAACLDAWATLQSNTDRAKCPIVSIGHPNEAGARLYADAIESAISHWAAGMRGTPTVKSLSITPSPIALPKGDSQKLTVTAHFSDGTTGDASTLITLTSSDTNVAAVDNRTLTVTAKNVGTATVTATLNSDTTVKTSVPVTVGRAVPRTLAITPTNPLVAVGKNLQLTATVTMSDGTTVSATATSTWRSSNTAVATVSSKGVVRGVAVGTATIGATYKDTNSSLTVTGSTIVTVLSGPPQITGFTPTSGSVGTQVTIQGANLLGVTSVTFGGVPAAQFTVNSSSSITAVVPNGARTGAIGVVSSLGSAKSKNKFTVR